jgi:RHS repeat-associated protein
MSTRQACCWFDLSRGAYRYEPRPDRENEEIADWLIRLTGDVNETWGYDTNGNRTHRNGSPIATFDAQDRILTQGSTSYSHNALGQRTEKNQLGQITRYSYDVFGGLKQVTLSNGTTIDYAQDPLGRRIGRKVNGTWTNKWLYKDQLNPIAELDGNDRLRKLFVYADKWHVPAYMITYNADGTEDKQYRIVSDLLGSVRVVYDLETGNEMQRMDYDVLGNVVNDTNPGFQPFAFAGGLYDSQTKLTRFGARDYDAETGRWTAKDPIQFKGGDTNLYGYVANDPVNFIDPSGLCKEEDKEKCYEKCIRDRYGDSWDVASALNPFSIGGAAAAGLAEYVQRKGEHARYVAGINDVADHGRASYTPGGRSPRLRSLLGALRGLGVVSAIAGAAAVGYQVGG